MAEIQTLNGKTVSTDSYVRPDTTAGQALEEDNTLYFQVGGRRLKLEYTDVDRMVEHMNNVKALRAGKNDNVGTSAAE